MKILLTIADSLMLIFRLKAGEKRGIVRYQRDLRNEELQHVHVFRDEEET